MTELMLKPALDKKGYRLKCRFTVEARPDHERLKRAALKAQDMFVIDMAKQGWEHLQREMPRLTGPFTPVVPMTLRIPAIPTSREMQYAVAQGAKFRAGEETMAQIVRPLADNDYWEYELALVFIRDTVLVEVPDRHEEIKRGA